MRRRLYFRVFRVFRGSAFGMDTAKEGSAYFRLERVPFCCSFSPIPNSLKL